MAEGTDYYQRDSFTEENGNSSHFNRDFDFTSLMDSLMNGQGNGSNNTYIVPQIGKVNTCNIGNTVTTNYNYPRGEETKSDVTTEAERLAEMISAVSDRIGGKWSELAEKLGLQKIEIDDIREDCCDKEDAMKCAAKAVFSKWQGNHPDNANCTRLTSALKLINASELIA